MAAKILLYALSVSALLYLLIILVFTTGWYKMEAFTESVHHFSTKISVVVAFRNESNHLKNLLTNLLNQNYPSELMEIILVNDHSEDQGNAVIKSFLKENKSNKISVIQAKGYGKKAALYEGILKANGNLIVTTDADCTVHENWLIKIASFFEQEKPLIILGPVVYSNQKGWLKKFFSLEFISLVASGAGSVGNNLPLMGNGANLAFERKVFLEAGIEAQKQQYPSGDDVFFIHYISKNYGRNTIRFIKNKEVIVQTPPPQCLNDFMNQRARWGSKAKGYTLPWPLIVSFTVLIFNGLLVTGFIYGFFTPWFWSVFILFVLFKFLIDFPLLNDFSAFTNNHNLILYLLPFELIYPLYLFFAAIKGLFFSYQWKGRKVRTSW